MAGATPFIGRGREIAAARRLFQPDGQRVALISEPAGMGRIHPLHADTKLDVHHREELSALLGAGTQG